MNKPLATRLLIAFDALDAFTIRELFVSLGTPMDNGFVITFNDGSQALSCWFMTDNSINDSILWRESPAEPWINWKAQ